MCGDRGTKRGAAGRLVLGGMLVLAGGALLAENAGFDVPGTVWSWWPGFLIALGLVKLLWPGGRDERGSGYWLLVVGIYGWVSTREVLGLDWGTAWPIAVLAVGLQIALESIAPKRRASTEEASHAK
jgi:hypothetical protein